MASDKNAARRSAARHPWSVLARMGSLVRFNRRLGPAKRLEGVGWSRIIEYAYAAEGLRPQAGQKLLDIGTGKHSIFPLWCAAEYGTEVVMTDLTDDVRAQERRLRRLSDVAARCRIELQDATDLSYPDKAFDLVSAVSTIEHIPGDGASRAVREFHRVLRPGGRCALTVPFAPDGHREVHRRRRAYARRYRGEPVFFQHEYDRESVKSRLLDAAPFSVEALWLFGEAGERPIARWNRRVPLRNVLKYLWGWRLTRLAVRSFRPLRREEERHASLAVAVLRKDEEN